MTQVQNINIIISLLPAASSQFISKPERIPQERKDCVLLIIIICYVFKENKSDDHDGTDLARQLWSLGSILRSVPSFIPSFFP